MTTLPVVVHRSRIVRENSIPGLECFQFVCSCGAASPAARDKDVAIIAKRAHLRENGGDGV